MFIYLYLKIKRLNFGKITPKYLAGKFWGHLLVLGSWNYYKILKSKDAQKLKLIKSLDPEYTPGSWPIIFYYYLTIIYSIVFLTYNKITTKILNE